MEILVAFLQTHGLLSGSFLALAGVLKYYITRDIATIRTDAAENKKSFQELKEYVRSSEERIETLLASQDKEISLMKLDTKHSDELITTKLETIATTLHQHVAWEETNMKDQQEFMGYVYRKLGNGDYKER